MGGLLSQFTQCNNLYFTLDFAFQSGFNLSGVVPQRQIQRRNTGWSVTQRVDCKDFPVQYDLVSRHLGRSGRGKLFFALRLQ